MAKLIAKSSNDYISLDGAVIPAASLWADGPRRILVLENHLLRFLPGYEKKIINLRVVRYTHEHGWGRAEVTPVLLEEICNYNRTYTFRVDHLVDAPVPPPERVCRVLINEYDVEAFSYKIVNKTNHTISTELIVEAAKGFTPSRETFPVELTWHGRVTTFTCHLIRSCGIDGGTKYVFLVTKREGARPLPSGGPQPPPTLPPDQTDSVLRELVIKATSHDMYSQQFDSNTAFQDWTNLRDYVQKQVVPAAALLPEKKNFKFKILLDGTDIRAISSSVYRDANGAIITVRTETPLYCTFENVPEHTVRIDIFFNEWNKESYLCRYRGASGRDGYNFDLTSPRLLTEIDNRVGGT